MPSAPPQRGRASDSSLIGTVVDGYEVRELLRADELASIYLAHHLGLRRDAELRVLRPDAVADDPLARVRFQQAAVATAALDHSSFLTVYAYGELDGTAWVASRIPTGPRLDEALDAGEVTAQRALRIVEQVAVALTTAHERGIVHRDVRPSTIWCVGPRAVLLGLPGVDRSDRMTRLSAEIVLGDPHYLAPEQLAGIGATAASDVYAMGAVFIACLVGEPPFGLGDTAAVLRRREQRARPRLVVRADGTPATPLDDVLRHIMAADPGERPAPADAVAMLARAMAELPEPLRDRAEAFALAGTQPPTLPGEPPVAAPQGPGSQAPGSQAPAPQAPAPPRKASRAPIAVAALGAVATVAAAYVAGQASVSEPQLGAVRSGAATFSYDRGWQAHGAAGPGPVAPLLRDGHALRRSGAEDAIAEVGVLRRSGPSVAPLVGIRGLQRSVARVGAREVVVYRGTLASGRRGVVLALPASGGTAVIACSARSLTTALESGCAALAAAARPPGRPLRPVPNAAVARGLSTAMLSLHNLVTTRQLALDDGAPASGRRRAIADVAELYRRSIEEVEQLRVAGPDSAVLQSVAERLRAVVAAYEQLRDAPSSAAARRGAVDAVDDLRHTLTALRAAGYKVGSS